MPELNFSQDPHRRYNILTGDWVLVSPHRNKRPWQGKQETPHVGTRPRFDHKCYLCPGNTRSNGATNPDYTDTFVFTNDFAALLPDSSKSSYTEGFLHAEGETGICKVICFSPDHSLTLPEMGLPAIRKVIDVWQEQYLEIGRNPTINHVQIFENKGEIMGCSNPHPHGQIWAERSIPTEVLKKTKKQEEYYQPNGSSLLKDYLEQELTMKERIISSNPGFVVLVPFWAVWPYEAMIIPRRHVPHLGLLTEEEKNQFAAILKDLTQRYDLLFNTSFPYSSGIHQSPTDGQDHPEWHMHMSFYPPLLRSATVKKFMVGYELFAYPQRDITPETAAERLRSV